MARQAKRLGLVALTLAGALLSTQAASAQFNPYVMPRFNPVTPVNPVLAPGSFSQPAASLAGGYDPYYGGYGYGLGPVGGAYAGLAEVYRSYGTVIMNMEQARSMREQAVQAKLETRKKRFDLEMYIRANTPTFIEEQTRIARDVLKRIHTQSMPGEIANGKALNVMLDDVRKFPNRKLGLEQVILSEHILLQLNVTASYYGLGLLRNDGKIAWTVAVVESVPPEPLKKLDVQAQALVKSAVMGKMDVNVFRDFSAELDRTYDDLVKRVNDLPGPQYLEAKRFLSDLKDARTALEKGEAQNQAAYQKAISGGKSVQEIAEFMIGKGLRFAPAAAQDEAAYRAFYSALVAFDVALNTEAPAVNTPPNGKDTK